MSGHDDDEPDEPDDLDLDDPEEVDPDADPTIDTDIGYVRKAMAELARNPDNGVSGADLIDYVAGRIKVDPDKVKRERAKRAMARLRKPGATQADGQLSFADLADIEPYDWEPDRLVMGPDGSHVENTLAKPSAKNAEADRAQRNFDRVAEQNKRRQVESRLYAQWALDQVIAGASWDDITFGRFVVYLRSQKPPPPPPTSTTP